MHRDTEQESGHQQLKFPVDESRQNGDNFFNRMFARRSRRKALDEQQRLMAALAQLQACKYMDFLISGNEICNQDPTVQGYRPITMFFPKAETLSSGESLTFVLDVDGYNQKRALMRALIEAVMEVHKRGVVLGAILPGTVYYRPLQPNPVRFLATGLPRNIGENIPIYTGGDFYHPMLSHLGQLPYVNEAVDWWQLQQLMLQIVGLDVKKPLESLNDEDQSVWRGLANHQAIELIRRLGFVPKNAGLPEEAYTVMSVFAKTWEATATDADWNDVWKLMYRKVGEVGASRGQSGVVVPFRRD